ncbi:membrane protein [Streptomyces sp. MUSC 125]|nr:membrane protein [Streptomyces sp. MUSC 125]
MAGARRRGRTVALIAGAGALGAAAGLCGGYVVQAGRAPTRLPPLSQPVVRQAKGGVPRLTAAQDRRVKTDGDLRKLLLKRPKGAREAAVDGGSDGWLDLAGYADDFTKPDVAFAALMKEGFRRAAVTGWRTSDTYVEIRLVQYRQETYLSAAGAVVEQASAEDARPATRSWPIPGTGDGTAYVHSRPESTLGYPPVYLAEAVASRGDLLMEVWVAGSRPITKEGIMDLAKRQAARL